jgi:hypothetical protein
MVMLPHGGDGFLRGQAVKNAETLTKILEKAGLFGGKDVNNGSGAGDRSS